MRRMGGLKNDLPITYWTFVVGAIAIAGVPPFAGFFSKDEILFRTFASGHTLLWAVGLLTALLTAAYMFRLVFMTFHGPSPSATQAAHDDHAHEHHGHDDHSHLHDAPPAMAFALIVLAIGSVTAGWLGLGGRFERFLEPSFSSASSVRLQPDVVPAGDVASIETTLMIVSVVVALVGIGLASYFWLKNRAAADRMADRFPGLHRVLEHKYYVDEIYDAVVVQPIKGASTVLLWKGIDAGLIDGLVNGVGGVVRGSSSSLRRLQTGSVRAYAASLFLGVVVILGWYLLR
jgi:NADH-quinone oxidoreductase subunit L